MARVTEDGIKGAVGNVVFYTMNGKGYMRSKPGKRKKKRGQVPNPITSIFGIVSTHSSRMVTSMRERFLFPFKLEVYNRVRGWMRDEYAAKSESADWELAARAGSMCQLNNETDLRDYYKTGVTVISNGAKIIVVLPEIHPKKDIKVPPRTMKVNIKLVASTSAFEGVVNTCSSYTTEISFNYDNEPVPAKALELQTMAGTGDIAVVALALEYQTSDSNGLYLAEKRWLPAAIIAIGKIKKQDL